MALVLEYPKKLNFFIFSLKKRRRAKTKYCVIFCSPTAPIYPIFKKKSSGQNIRIQKIFYLQHHSSINILHWKTLNYK